jgi:glucose-1-phosphate cytidylyltransferase
MKGFARYGFTRFILCLGYKSWVIKRYFLDYHLAGADFTLDLRRPEQYQVHGPALPEDWQVTLAETGVYAMTGCRVKRVERYVTGDTFLLTYGDGVADVNLRRLVAFHKRHGRLATVTAVRPPGRFGEIEVEGRQAVEFNEKPVRARGRVSGGYFVFQRAVFDRLGDDPELVLEQGPLRRLARDGELMAYPHNGFWQGMDSSRDFQYLNDLWDQGKAPWNVWDRPRAARRAVAEASLS